MANKRKQHLKYQAKKGRLQTGNVAASTLQPEATATPVDVTEQSDTSKNIVAKKTSKAQQEKAEISKLPEVEVTFVRKELIYLIFVAMVLLTFYLVIWLVFKYTQIDEYLYSLIKLKA